MGLRLMGRRLIQADSMIASTDERALGDRLLVFWLGLALAALSMPAGLAAPAIKLKALTPKMAPVGCAKARYVIGTASEIDINCTDNLDLAATQVERYPDSPEAHFVRAVALSRTSQIGEALLEVIRARKMAQKLGDPKYFDRLSKRYEEMLEAYPQDYRVRYALAWVYYMRACLFAVYARKVTNSQHGTTWTSQLDEPAAAGSGGVTGAVGYMRGPFREVQPWAAAYIKGLYVAASRKLDEVAAQRPTDVVPRAYRYHFYAEYTEDLPTSMKGWQALYDANPDAAICSFFLSVGYACQGDKTQSRLYAMSFMRLRYEDR